MEYLLKKTASVGLGFGLGNFLESFPTMEEKKTQSLPSESMSLTLENPLPESRLAPCSKLRCRASPRTCPANPSSGAPKQQSPGWGSLTQQHNGAVAPLQPSSA